MHTGVSVCIYCTCSLSAHDAINSNSGMVNGDMTATGDFTFHFMCHFWLDSYCGGY